MTIRVITCTCDMKMSENFQSVGISRSVEFELSEGEKAAEEIAKVNVWLTKSVRRDCREALADTLNRGAK